MAENLHEQQNNPDYPTLEELLSGMTLIGRYAHLKIILTHKAGHRQDVGGLYLFVSQYDFTIVRLVDLYYESNFIHVFINEIFTNKQITHTLDIHDTRFKFLLMFWDDIKDLIEREKNILPNPYITGSYDSLLPYDL